MKIKYKRREQLLATLNNANEPQDGMLAGFWHHFLENEKQQVFGYRDEKIISRVIAAQKQFYDNTHPGFVKIMSDGFFLLPNLLDVELDTASDLEKIKRLSADDPWIMDQTAMVKRIVAHYQGQIGSFYNVFSPWYQLRLRFEILDGDPNKIYRFFREEPALFKRTLMELATDLKLLVELLLRETGIEGIYLCVQQPQGNGITLKHWEDSIKPSELSLLAQAQKVKDNNLLHICGFDGKRNDLTAYREYPFKAVNWATHIEQVSLEEGKRIFGGRAVLGGFANTEKDILFKADQQELIAATSNLINETGTKGFLVGADCSVPFKIDDERLRWVNKVARVYGK